jgi:hypothetical protein
MPKATPPHASQPMTERVVIDMERVAPACMTDTLTGSDSSGFLARLPTTSTTAARLSDRRTRAR